MGLREIAERPSLPFTWWHCFVWSGVLIVPAVAYVIAYRGEAVAESSDTGVPWMVKIPTADGKELRVYPHPFDDGSYAINVVTRADEDACDGRCWGIRIRPVPVERAER